MHLPSALHRELWTSWASLLRSYTGAHGLNSAQQAVVEVGSEEIVVRVGSRWLRFTHTSMSTSEDAVESFAFEEDGTVWIGGSMDEMGMGLPTLQALETMCKGRQLADVVAVIGSIDR